MTLNLGLVVPAKKVDQDTDWSLYRLVWDILLALITRQVAVLCVSNVLRAFFQFQVWLMILCGLGTGICPVSSLHLVLWWLVLHEAHICLNFISKFCIVIGLGCTTYLLRPFSLS